MRVYHVTKSCAAIEIAAGGFLDSEGHFLTDNLYRGVWISDRPLIIESGYDIEELACFELEIEEAHLIGHEWIEEGKGYREWLVPASVLNAHAATRRLTTDEVFDLEF